jgi:hypothetical protein
VDGWGRVGIWVARAQACQCRGMSCLVVSRTRKSQAASV